MSYLNREIVFIFKIILPLAVLVVLSLWFTMPALAADLEIVPSLSSQSVDQSFVASVRLLPRGDSAYAVETTLAYDTSKLAVVSINKDRSAIAIWTTEPTVSDGDGIIKLAGRSLSPLTSPSNIIDITFRPIEEGVGNLNFLEASILATDGFDTNIYKNSTQGTYVVTEGISLALVRKSPSEAEELSTPGSRPQPPEIYSELFSHEDVWHNNTSEVFELTVPVDVTEIAVELSTSSENRPENNKGTIYDPLPIGEPLVTKEILQEGVQYISVNFRNEVGWGSPTNQKLQIDTQKPEPFFVTIDPALSDLHSPMLRFEAIDKTSGIEYYELTIAGKGTVRVTPDEARAGYPLRELEYGTHSIEVLAVDRAGNVREGDATFLLTTAWTNPAEKMGKTSLRDYLTPTNLFIIFLLFIIALQIMYFWYEHNKYKERDEKLRRETREIQDQMEKIFLALRAEIYDQIVAITKKKKLSIKEREAVEGLTRAVEVSETLIEKEINDVKIILQ